MLWNYSKLYKKADEFEQRLPQMIEEDDWAAIHNMLSTMLDSISGATADAFKRAIEGGCQNKDASCILAFPEVIRSACEQMKSRDAANASTIKNSFTSF